MILSLKRWPQQALLESHYSLSPLTEKVIQSSGILVKEVIPISYLQFSLQMGLEEKLQNDNLQLFNNFNERRKRKVQLLQRIRKNIVQSKRKTKIKRSNSSKMLKSITSLSIGKKGNKSISLKRIQFERKNKSPQPKTKIKSTQKTEAYFNYYTSNQKKSKIKIKHKESTRQFNRQKHLTPQQYIHEDYYHQNSFKTQRIDRSTKDDMKDYLMLQISQALNKWVDIDKAHSKEFQEMEDLSQKQKNRLKKIHYIERQQLREEIKTLKKKLSYTQTIIFG